MLCLLVGEGRKSLLLARSLTKRISIEIRPLEDTDADVEDVTEFVLEKYLEDFIVSNFATIFQGKLVLYRDPEENVVGQQYTTDVGIIDILAIEPSTNNLIVIELKKDVSQIRLSVRPYVILDG